MGMNLNNAKRYLPQGPHFRDAQHKRSSPQIAVRLDDKTLLQIKQRAAKNQLSASKVIRELVNRALKFGL